jgi:pSer/pThr/pTyr-binding forkhead associated (FHA) protein
MAYLEIETRESTRRVPLEREHLSIGRLSYNDVVLPFAQISRQHAELRRVNGQWWIADLQSTNGLQINSRRIQEHALSTGDRIVLAPGISIVFMADSAGDGLPPRSAPPPARREVEPPVRWGQLLPTLPEEDESPPRSDSWIASSAPVGGNGFADQLGPGSPMNGPLVEGYDHYRRESPSYDHVRVTAGPVGTLLHVCQTCGQRTAPDAIYCQSCHNSIAHECSTCYLSLLPIQERCPRCHTPNVMSVRRAHPGRGI